MNNKKISCYLENSLAKILKAKLFENSGIDLLLENGKYIEVKSSYTYSNYSCSYRNQKHRFSCYSIKANELNNKSWFYAFIEKRNKLSNFKYIKSLEIYFIKTKHFRNYLIKQNKDFSKRIQISVNAIKRIKYKNLNEFIDYLENKN